MIVEYKRISVFYNDQGSGNVVVLLHGFLETSVMWRDIVPELAKTHRVIALDLLGHGQTGCLGYVHSMEMMAEMVHFVLDHLNIAKASFIGHSMGGYVALAMAEAFPDMVQGLCLLNSSPFADSEERRVNRERAIRMVKYQKDNFVRLAIGNLFQPENRETHKSDIEQMKQEALKIGTQGVVAALEGMKIRRERCDVLQMLQAPKTVMLGTRDTVLDYKALKSAVEALGVEVESISSGHMSYIENKKEVLEKLKHFIETKTL